jgi:elongation factor P hydroxylase
MIDTVHPFTEGKSPTPGDHTPAVVDLIGLFDATFAVTDNTVLRRSEGDPLYLPAEPGLPARLLFAHGFFSSALHEIAHWCVAGPARRQQVDLGYWYAPDGRTPEQQRDFEQLEVRPQALEWIFSVAAGCSFRVSCDNLEHGPYDIEAFRKNIHAEVMRRLREGLPERAGRLVAALQGFYGTPPLSAGDFCLDALR